MFATCWTVTNGLAGAGSLTMWSHQHGALLCRRQVWDSLLALGIGQYTGSIR